MASKNKSKKCFINGNDNPNDFCDEFISSIGIMGDFIIAMMKCKNCKMWK